MRMPQGPSPPNPAVIATRLDTLVNSWGATFVRMVIQKNDTMPADGMSSMDSDISAGSQHLQVCAPEHPLEALGF